MKFSVLSAALLPLTILASPFALPSQDENSALDISRATEESETTQSGTCSIKDPWRGQAVICSQFPTSRSSIIYKFTGKSIPVECYTPSTAGGRTGPGASVYFRVASPNGACYIADGDMEMGSVCKGMLSPVSLCGTV